MNNVYLLDVQVSAGHLLQQLLGKLAGGWVSATYPRLQSSSDPLHQLAGPLSAHEPEMLSSSFNAYVFTDNVHAIYLVWQRLWQA